MSADPTTSPLGWRSLVALGAALAILVGLGTWQLQRKQWKEALLAEIAARGAAAPVTSLSGAQEYQRIVLDGQFEPSPQRFVFIAVPKQASGVGGPGYWVFQPFRIATTTGVVMQVFVNRGFVPEAEARAGQNAWPSDATRIEGIVRRAEVRTAFSNANDPVKNVYYVRSPTEFVAGLALPKSPALNIYVDMTGPVPATGLPLPMVGKITIPNRHLEYALTWYALAATLAGVAFALWRRG
jgi:surfeit locus 1 family protein